MMNSFMSVLPFWMMVSFVNSDSSPAVFAVRGVRRPPQVGARVVKAVAVLVIGDGVLFRGPALTRAQQDLLVQVKLAVLPLDPRHAGGVELGARAVRRNVPNPLRRPHIVVVIQHAADAGIRVEP